MDNDSILAQKDQTKRYWETKMLKEVSLEPANHQFHHNHHHHHNGHSNNNNNTINNNININSSVHSDGGYHVKSSMDAVTLMPPPGFESTQQALGSDDFVEVVSYLAFVSQLVFFLVKETLLFLIRTEWVRVQVPFSIPKETKRN